MNIRTILRTIVPIAGVVGLALAGGALVAQESRQDAQAPRVDAPSVMVRSLSSTGYMGAFIREVTAEDVERLDLDEERGVFITGVQDDGPAAKAGLREDDVLVSWNGSRLESAVQLRRIVSETPVGRSADVGYVRDGRERSTRIEVGRRSGFLSRGAPMARFDGPDRQRLEEALGAARLRMDELGKDGGGIGSFFAYMSGGRLGVGIQTLGDQLAEYFGVDDGVLVTSVREDTPAAEAGLRAGDVIVEFNGQNVGDPGELMRAVAEAEAGEVEIDVVRDRRSRTLRATLPEAESGRIAPGSSSFYFRSPEDGDGEPWVIMGDGSGFDFEVPGLRFDVPGLRFDLPEVLLEIPEFRFEIPEIRSQAPASIET